MTSFVASYNDTLTNHVPEYYVLVNITRTNITVDAATNTTTNVTTATEEWVPSNFSFTFKPNITQIEPHNLITLKNGDNLWTNSTGKLYSNLT